MRLVQQARRKALVLHFSVTPAALVSSKMSALVAGGDWKSIPLPVPAEENRIEKKHANQKSRKETKIVYLRLVGRDKGFNFSSLDQSCSFLSLSLSPSLLFVDLYLG